MRRVLVVDDEPDIRLIVRMAFEEWGDYEVKEAESGPVALALLGSQKFQVVLLDVMMPDVDGLTVLQAIRSDPRLRDLPVVVLTAKVQPPDIARFRQLKASGVIHKPFDPVTLPEEVEAILSTQSHAAPE
ncbi:MAG: response regulator [Myxococcota bacterium]